MKTAVLLLLCCLSAFAQKPVYATWTLQADPASAAPGGKALIRAAAKIEPGWHLYSASSPEGIPATFQVGPDSIVESLRVLQTPPKRAFDPNFGSDTETFEGDAVFLVELQLKKDAPAGSAQLPVKIRYQTCTDKLCVPGRYEGTVALNIGPAAAAAVTIPAGYSEAKRPAPGSQATPAQDQSLGAFMAMAFGLGLASLITPCVFPMIPITMSYFINRQSGLAQAVVFCLGIIVLFSGLGLATRILLGPFAVVQLGSNPWVNGFISALLIAFGLSLLGAFEITIPSSILTRLNASSENGGFIGTLLMGLTFCLASFACIGPFVGTILAASVTGGGYRPLIGMVTFATGLALPFFLLALFPSYLKRLPRSGGWMSRVKVVMGFVILAASLKYLSSVDQVLQWGFVTRERFLAVWIVLFAMAGLYLLGFLRFEGIKPDEPLGVPRLLIGMAFLILAISLFPGMFGGRLGDLDAYVPVASGGSGGPGGSGGGLVWMKDQYREALARARREGKFVFVNFTGYACASCHWMKANMFTRPEIAAAMQGFVLVELYCDAGDATSEENQNLELKMFQTIAQPFYAILDPDEKVIATFGKGKTSDAAEFLAFLQKGAGAPGERAPEAGVPGAGAPGAGAPGVPAAAAAAPSTGLPRVKTLDGSDIDPAIFSGKVTVVNFWATWCVPCIKEIPSFNKLHRDFASKGVAVVGASLDEEGAAQVRPFLKKHPIEYLVALGPQEFFTTYRLDLLPVTLIFDRAGKQIQRLEGYTEEDALFAAVQKAL